MSDRHTIKSGRAEIAAWSQGAGPAVVFLHAGVADSRMWADQTARVAERHRAITFDRRGFGQTKAVPEEHSSVGDLLRVLDEFGAGPAVLVGSSQGGRVALDAALEHPGQVRGLILLAPSVDQAPPAVHPAATTALLAELKEAEEAGELQRVNELEAHLWLDGPLEPAGRVGGRARDLFLAMNEIALGAPDSGRSLDAFGAYRRLEEITAPTLVGWGDLDLAHIQERSRYLAQAIGSARSHEFHGAAHLPSLEQPAIVADAIAGFLESL